MLVWSSRINQWSGHTYTQTCRCPSFSPYKSLVQNINENKLSTWQYSIEECHLYYQYLFSNENSSGEGGGGGVFSFCLFLKKIPMPSVVHACTWNSDATQVFNVFVAQGREGCHGDMNRKCRKTNLDILPVCASIRFYINIRPVIR